MKLRRAWQVSRSFRLSIVSLLQPTRPHLYVVPDRLDQRRLLALLNCLAYTYAMLIP